MKTAKFSKPDENSRQKQESSKSSTADQCPEKKRKKVVNKRKAVNNMFDSNLPNYFHQPYAVFNQSIYENPIANVQHQTGEKAVQNMYENYQKYNQYQQHTTSSERFTQKDFVQQMQPHNYVSLI